jgi:hypothetical protein
MPIYAAMPQNTRSRNYKKEASKLQENLVMV